MYFTRSIHNLTVKYIKLSFKNLYRYRNNFVIRCTSNSFTFDGQLLVQIEQLKRLKPRT